MALHPLQVNSCPILIPAGSKWKNILAKLLNFHPGWRCWQAEAGFSLLSSHAKSRCTSSGRPTAVWIRLLPNSRGSRTDSLGERGLRLLCVRAQRWKVNDFVCCAELHKIANFCDKERRRRRGGERSGNRKAYSAKEESQDNALLDSNSTQYCVYLPELPPKKKGCHLLHVSWTILFVFVVCLYDCTMEIQGKLRQKPGHLIRATSHM